MLARATALLVKKRSSSTMASSSSSSARRMSTGKARSATYVLIGDEILSGTVKDTNGPFLANYFRQRGIDLLRIEVIPDKIDVIVETLQRVIPKSDYVVTSGGIGPTHDDVTYEAVATTFGVPLEYDPVTLEKMSVYMKSRNSEMNDARKRMALFPKGSSTAFTSPDLWVPVVIMGNVHIYPGVPRLFERLLSDSNELFLEGRPFVQYEVFTHQLEGDFAQQLTCIASENPELKIGSYPSLDDKGRTSCRLFIEGRDEILVKAVADQLSTITSAYLVAPRPIVDAQKIKL